jgi:hypothetical protein
MRAGLDLIEVIPRSQSQRHPKFAINKTGLGLIKQLTMRSSINTPTFTSFDGCEFICDRPYGRLWKEVGCTTALRCTEHTSWMLFLKYLDYLEHGWEIKAELGGKPYAFIIDNIHR